MKSRTLSTLVISALALTTPALACAQGGDSQLVVGVGVVLYDGASNESGVGVGGRLEYELALAPALRLGLEVGAHTLSTVGQTCTLGVPSDCSPATPASPVWHVRAGVSGDLFRPSPIYLTAGLGLYGPVGRADDERDLSAGIDVGLGIRVSPRVALEASYVNLRASRHVGHSIPLGVEVRL